MFAKTMNMPMAMLRALSTSHCRLFLKDSVYVICAIGGRSARAAEFLRGQGIDAINVAGGTNGWVDSGRAVVLGDSPV